MSALSPPRAGTARGRWHAWFDPCQPPVSRAWDGTLDQPEATFIVPPRQISLIRPRKREAKTFRDPMALCSAIRGMVAGRVPSYFGGVEAPSYVAREALRNELFWPLFAREPWLSCEGLMPHPW